MRFLLTITKYAATRRNPGGPKERQVRVPSKKAAPMPDRLKPEIKIGDPRMKITRLLSTEDSQVGGEDWTSWIAFCMRLRSLPEADGVVNMFLVFSRLEFEKKGKGLKGLKGFGSWAGNGGILGCWGRRSDDGCGGNRKLNRVGKEIAILLRKLNMFGSVDCGLGKVEWNFSKVFAVELVIAEIYRGKN